MLENHGLPLAFKPATIDSFNREIHAAHRNFVPMELQDGAVLRSFGVYRHGLIRDGDGQVEEVLLFSRNPEALTVGPHPYADRFSVPIEGQYWQESDEVDKIFVVDGLSAKQRQTHAVSQIRWANRAIGTFESWWMETVFNVGTLKRINEDEWDSRYIGYRRVRASSKREGLYDLECYPSSGDIKIDIPVHDYARRNTRPILAFLLSAGAKRWRNVTAEQVEEIIRQDFPLRSREVLRRHNCYTVEGETCGDYDGTPQTILDIGGEAYMRLAEAMIVMRHSINQNGAMKWAFDLALIGFKPLAALALAIASKIADEVRDSVRDAAVDAVTSDGRHISKDKAEQLRHFWREDRQGLKHPNRYEKISQYVLERIFFPDSHHNNARHDVGDGPYKSMPVNWAIEYILGPQWPVGGIAELFDAGRQIVLKVEEATGLTIYYMPALQRAYAHFDPSKEVLDEDHLPVTGALPQAVKDLFKESPYIVVANASHRFDEYYEPTTHERWIEDFVKNAQRAPDHELNLDLLVPTDVISGKPLPDDAFEQYDNDDAFRRRLAAQRSRSPQ
ncbi:MAG: hypothetical protein GC136_06595 [Alphaproteobacteria bacterium]|nr:hypothetical protein [Alphaproteobacteria bacterium]